MRSAPSPASARDRRRAVNAVRFRRAVMLMVMTLFVPGSAQIVAGNKRVGRLAVRVWGGVIGVVVAVALIGMIDHEFVFWLISNTAVLGFVRFALVGLALAWAWLFVDAWRLGDPMRLRQKQRLAMVGINGVLCFSVAGALLFASHTVAQGQSFISAMFTSNKVTSAHEGRFNVLLLGGDSGASRWGLRPDSITVASIDANTGQTVLFGLPRNMQNFPFAPGSTMAKQYPDGYNCASCELNSLFTWALDHSSLFQGDKYPGVTATEQAVEGITGLKINYFAMVNLAGFQRLVDAVGGVTLNVRQPIPIGAIGDFHGQYVPAGVRKLNGFQTLWFARSRMAADDYSRMARQKCVMNAMLHQLSPQQVVLKFGDIAKASTAMVETDIPSSQLDTFIQLALDARQHPIHTVSFVPPLIETYQPDIAKIQGMVKKSIADSQKPPAPGAKKNRPAKVPASAVTTGGSVGTIQDGYAANQATDLGSTC